jgi:hypothetical protein
MAIGMNDLDFDDDVYESESNYDTTTQTTDNEEINTNDFNDYYVSEESEEVTPIPELDDRGIISEFLRSKGVEDISKLQYENEDGTQEDVDWDTLDSSEKLNILNQLNSSNDTDLDNSEIELINSIRQSKMSPTEYLNYIAQQGANSYAQSLNNAA